MPNFQVADDSEIQVYETKSSIQTAMADQSFSQTDIQAEA